MNPENPLPLPFIIDGRLEAGAIGINCFNIIGSEGEEEGTGEPFRFATISQICMRVLRRNNPEEARQAERDEDYRWPRTWQGLRWPGRVIRLSAVLVI